MIKCISAIGLACALSACATTSFAPPSVDRHRLMMTGGTNSCATLKSDPAKTIGRTVDGALDLMDNFELAYSCASRDLANGRRYFEVPSFLLGVAGLVGPSLGMGPDGKLLAATGAGLLGYGNNYFAPKAKAAVVTSAHRAVVCMQTESVGIGAFKNKPNAAQLTALYKMVGDLRLGLEQAQGREALAAASSPALLAENLASQEAYSKALRELVVYVAETRIMGDIKINADVQYFQMIRGGLGTVHSILDERLRNSGATDTKAVFDELKALAQKHKEAKDALDGATKPPVKGQGVQGYSASVSPNDLVTLKVEELRPRIETCVLQARL